MKQGLFTAQSNGLNSTEGEADGLHVHHVADPYLHRVSADNDALYPTE